MSILLTLPLIEACWGMDTNPEASAIFCPAFTSSPTFTKGVDGEPMCWDREMITFWGRGSSSIGTEAE